MTDRMDDLLTGMDLQDLDDRHAARSPTLTLRRNLSHHAAPLLHDRCGRTVWRAQRGSDRPPRWWQQTKSNTAPPTHRRAQITQAQARERADFVYSQSTVHWPTLNEPHRT